MAAMLLRIIIHFWETAYLPLPKSRIDIFNLGNVHTAPDDFSNRWKNVRRGAAAFRCYAHTEPP